MLQKVEVYGFPALPLELPLNSEESPIQILGMDGIGPVKANINKAQMSKYEIITGITRSSRNIVLTLGLNPDWVTETPESLRMKLYEYFSPELPVRMRFKSTHMPEVEIMGIVEDMVPTIFSQDPTYQVSIICEKPNFYGIERKGTFGFSDNNGASTPQTLEYLGTEPAGFLFSLMTSQNRPDYEGPVQVFTSPEPNTFFFSGRMDSARITEWSTVLGEKYVQSRTPSTGVRRTLLSSVPNGMKWPVLRKGTNQIRVTTTSAPGVLWTLSYIEQFGGL